MGLTDFVKKVFSKSDVVATPEVANEDPFEALMESASAETIAKNKKLWSVKASELDTYNLKIATLPVDEKVSFALHCIEKIDHGLKTMTAFNSNNVESQKHELRNTFLQHILRSKLVLSDSHIEALTNQFISHQRYSWRLLLYWPIGLFLVQIEKHTKSNQLSDTVKEALLSIKSELEKIKHNSFDKEKAKLTSKINFLLHSSEGEHSIQPVYFLGKDDFASYANTMLRQGPVEELAPLYKILEHTQKASGGKPTQKFLKEGQALIAAFGIESYKQVVGDWFTFIIQLKERRFDYYYLLLSTPNSDAVKGLIWLCSGLHDSSLTSIIAALAERSFRKVPGQGPAALSVGNACLYSLYKTEGLEGISHLSRLKLRIRQSSTQSLIDKYLNEAAKEQGISVYEIEDLAVDSYELIDGKRSFEIEGYTAVLEIVAVGKTEVNWYKPDGNSQKTVPNFVKEKHADTLKLIKETAKKVEVTLSAQRDRLDRMFKADRSLSWEYFQHHYLNHGLLSFLTKRLIWIFEKEGEQKSAFHFNGKWITVDQNEVQSTTDLRVRLWHPALATVQEIEAWRAFLVENEILQPFKQAYREVYLLTDAEVNTRFYSNRMAAHILKQHQFNSLAKIRGWKYSLLGAYDDGRDNEAASCLLPDYGLRAEYWVNEVNANDAFNETGIWLYVATDQLRFLHVETNNLVELIDIPKVPFSEIMRDVDLFVGVSTVGNDPAWQDSGGVPAHRDYWQSYSFGDLSEVAKTRKAILESLVPRLKIGNVSQIQDRFLVVKGKLRTYKIHLGSTNILMEPNDQYLCIVPDRSKKNNTGNVFLPFEGDNGLSVILSKALMLADDDKITDSTITSQIRRPSIF